MRVPFFDRTRGDAALEPELTAAFQRVLRSGQFILGREVEAFERACAAYLGVRHAIGVSSGSDALIVALLALAVGPGDEVICPAYSFFATAGSIARLGAVPVFADIDPTTYTLDPASAAARLSPRTRAIVPVHLFGRAADTGALAAITGVPILEDAAQAIGASRGGRRTGALGAIGAFSLFPSKNLGGFGDGGLVTTDDDALAARARALRVHGTREKHRHELLGGNYRLDALQAALLGVKLPHLDAAIARRRAHAARYDALFREAGLAGADDAPLVLPLQGDEGTYNQYVIRVRAEGRGEGRGDALPHPSPPSAAEGSRDPHPHPHPHPPGRRDRLRAFLAERGVGTEVYYPTPIHRQPCFEALGYGEGSLPNAEQASRATLALPIFPELSPDEVAYVAAQVSAFFADARGDVE